MKHKLLLIYAWFIHCILFFFPDIPVFMRFRGWLYGLAMDKCGRNLQVAHSVIINGLDLCSMEDNVYIANACNIICNGKLIIGKDVIFGPGVLVSTGNHQFDGNSFRNKESEKSDVHIGAGSWIGGNACVLGGANVPEKSVVAAGSVVLKNSCDGASGVYAGNPAKFIKSIV